MKEDIDTTTTTTTTTYCISKVLSYFTTNIFRLINRRNKKNVLAKFNNNVYVVEKILYITIGIICISIF